MSPILEIECPAWKKTRYRLAFMVFIGNIILMSLRFNLSVAMVDMVKPIGKSETIGECGISSIVRNETREDMFDWDGHQQGLALGAFFYGYCVTQILGGYLADNYSARVLFGVGVGSTAILSLFIPLSTRSGLAGLIAIRALIRDLKF